MSALRRAVIFGGLFVGAVAAPIACFYPSYTFDDTGVGGGGGEPSSTSSTTTSGEGAASSTTTTGSMSGSGPGSGGSGNQGGGGTGPASSSSSSGTGGIGGNGGPEDCTNGIDDNADGETDCKDPLCGGYTCASSVPAGWTGYFAVFDGVGDPDCRGDYPTQSFLGQSMFSAPPATCSACNCGGPTAQTCVGPTTVTIFDGTCAGSDFCSGPLNLGAANGACFFDNIFSDNATTCGMNSGPMCDMGSTACNQSASTTGTSVSGGSCPPSGGVPTLPPATFANTGRVCGGVVTTGKGCNGAQACLPKPDPALYSPGVCVSKPGDVGCPAVFTEKHTFFTGSTDTRGCTNCGCQTPTGSTCAANVTLYPDNTCSGAAITTFAAGSCADLAANPEIHGRKTTVTSPPSGGSCTTTGGQPSGAATATGAVTYCCTP